MNQIKPIKKLPELDWSNQAQKEIVITGEDLLDQSTFAWEVGGILVVGFIYTSLLAPPWMWFALAKGVTIRHLVDFRRLVDYIPLGTTTAIESEFKEGIRFAKLYKFEDTGETRDYAGLHYKIFRRV